MNSKQLVLLFCVTFSLTACLSWKSKLEREMVRTPVSQKEIDKNRILDYAIKKDLQVKGTDSGLYYFVNKEGDEDDRPDKDSQITAHYTGSFLDGRVFDSSKKRGEPLNFQLDEVIKGWQEALPLIGKGGSGTFLIPSHLAYGENGAGLIPPNEVLVFDIELLEIDD